MTEENSTGDDSVGDDDRSATAAADEPQRVERARMKASPRAASGTASSGATIAGRRPPGARKTTGSQESADAVDNPDSIDNADSADSTDNADSADNADTAADSATSAPNVRTRLVLAAVAVVIVALVISAVVLFMNNRSAGQGNAELDRLLQTARQTALNLTTVHADTADEDVQRLLDGAAGGFLEQFRDGQSDFVSVMGQSGVNSDGSVVAAGIESVEDDCAVTLVAANATITNATISTGEAAQPQDRYFRFRITVCDIDGEPKATNVEFVS